jgi:glycosyltransferase involved in cell wall biosynthesis
MVVWIREQMPSEISPGSVEGGSAATAHLEPILNSSAEQGRPRQPLKIAVITPTPTPYRDPFWGEVARRREIELEVLYCAAGTSDRPWATEWSREMRCSVLPGYNLFHRLGDSSSCFWNPSVLLRLRQGRFDAVVLGGYNHPTMIAAALWAKTHRVPYFLMCESHLRSRRSTWKQWVKARVVGWFVRNAAGLFPTGQLAADYLVHYGADRANLAAVPNVPDVNQVRDHVSDLRRDKSFPVPPELEGRPIVLFVARLIPKKRPELLIRAFCDAPAAQDAVLVIAGDGPLRPELEQLVERLGLRSRVHFTGFLQPAELLGWYACASVFVLPSSETWGVVVIEALSAGVPVIISDETGSCADAINDSAVGTIIPAGDQAALSRALESHLSRPSTPEIVHQSWEPVRRQMTYEAIADRFVSLVGRCCRGGKLSG